MNIHIAKSLSCCVCFLLPAMLSAATVIDIHIEEYDDRYNMYVEAILNAEPDQVMRVINDYEQLHHINTDMIESKVISTEADGSTTVSLLTRSCILVFCYNIRHVQNMYKQGPYMILGEYIPEASDFRYGWSNWTITSVKKDDKPATLLMITMEMEPDFFIMPVIGPYHLKSKMIDVTTTTVHNLEAAALKTPVD